MSDEAAATEETTETVTVTGSIPDANGSISGTIRITTVVDLTYADGVLTEIGFNAAQYTAFSNGKTLGVKSTFPKKGKSGVTNTK